MPPKVPKVPKNIHYKKFRRQAIEMLVSRYPARHGLLVNHTMGTGKTKTALLFLANFPQRPKLIVAPVSAHAEWVSGLRQFELKEYQLLTFEELGDAKVTRSHVCVIDECHLLVPLLTTDRLWPVRKRDHIMTELQKICFKIMLLTGTPVRSQVSDLRLLVNIAAGRNIIPATRKEFRAKYYKVSVSRAVTLGYLTPIVLEPTYKFFKNMIQTTLAYAIFSRIIMHIVAYFQFKRRTSQQIQEMGLVGDQKEKVTENILKNKGIIDYLANFDDIYGQGFFSTLVSFTSDVTDVGVNKRAFRKFYQKQQIMACPSHTSSTVLLNLKLLLQQLCQLRDSGCENEYQFSEEDKTLMKGPPEIPTDLFKLKDIEQEKFRWTIPIWRFMYMLFKPLNTLTKWFSNLDIALLSLLGLYVLKVGFNMYKDLGEIVELDASRLSRDLQAHMVTYDPFLSRDRAMLRHFPEVTYTTQEEDLTLSQVRVLQKIMLGMVSPEEFVDLGFLPSEVHAQVYEAHEHQPYKYYGRMVSNLLPSRKFQAIIEAYLARQEPTLIWSNFEQGLVNFQAEAEARGLTTSRLERETKHEQLHAALEGKVDFLLLPPHMVEGISLPGIRQMHILEPPDSVITYEQLQARVVRYMQNRPDDLKVTVTTWLSILPSRRRMFEAMMKIWTQVGYSEEPFTFAKRLTHDASPDTMVWSEMQNARRDFVALSKSLTGMERRSRPPPEVCVPVQPSKRATCPRYFQDS